MIHAPEKALAVMSAALVGLIVYFGVSIMGKVLFKKTSQQTAGMARLGYGASGAVGALYGLFLVWIAILSIRLLGSVAETRSRWRRIRDFHRGNPAHAGAHAGPAPSAMVLGLAHMKQSLEQGAAGSMVQQVDPIPGTLYGIFHKLGMMVSDDHSVERFLSYPGSSRCWPTRKSPRSKMIRRSRGTS